MQNLLISVAKAALSLFCAQRGQAALQWVSVGNGMSVKLGSIRRVLLAVYKLLHVGQAAKA